MSAVATDTITVNLEADCCDELAVRLHAQLDKPKYTRGVALMAVPESRAAWEEEHRTARKRAWRAERLGYRFAEVDMSLYNDDRHEINTSLDTRQGRPMGEGYLVRRNHGPLPDYRCDRHRIHTYGVIAGRHLRAYLSLYRVGELAMVSMILGHGDYLRDDIMWLLFAGTVEMQAGQRGFFYYNRWDSGLDGLRYYKQHVGFAPSDVEWSLS